MFLAATVIHMLAAMAFAFVAFLIMIVILLQRGRGVGLAGAFGGAGGPSATFGAKTGDFLTWVTVIGATVFLIFAVLLNYLFLPAKTVIAQPPATPNTPNQPAGGPAAPPLDAQLSDDWHSGGAGIFGEPFGS
ncbi:MAG: preprotein translocase subunit SecG [Phycisphaerales bacterium]|nr:preprotein translocase subunit SecG [Phycisphaerales bacterium]